MFQIHSPWSLFIQNAAIFAHNSHFCILFCSRGYIRYQAILVTTLLQWQITLCWQEKNCPVTVNVCGHCAQVPDGRLAGNGRDWCKISGIKGWLQGLWWKHGVTRETFSIINSGYHLYWIERFNTSSRVAQSGGLGGLVRRRPILTGRKNGFKIRPNRLSCQQGWSTSETTHI